MAKNTRGSCSLSQFYFKNKENRMEDLYYPSVPNGTLPERGLMDTGRKNYFHLIGAAKCSEDSGVNVAWGTSYYSTNAAFIWVQSIEEQDQDYVLQAVENVVCHEIGHQFDTLGATHMHCNEKAYTPVGAAPDDLICIMYESANNGDGHTEDQKSPRYCLKHILTGWLNENPPYYSRRDQADGR